MAVPWPRLLLGVPACGCRVLGPLSAGSVGSGCPWPHLPWGGTRVWVRGLRGPLSAGSVGSGCPWPGLPWGGSRMWVRGLRGPLSAGPDHRVHALRLPGLLWLSIGPRPPPTPDSGPHRTPPVTPPFPGSSSSSERSPGPTRGMVSLWEGFGVHQL